MMPKEQHRFAIVCARGLGDALLSMILAHNLTLSGSEVTTFSSILCELKDWFPGYNILPYPADLHTFSLFDTVIAADHSLVKEYHQFGNTLLILKERVFDRERTMVANLQSVCKQRLTLPFSFPENGIVPLQGLSWRKYSKRVLLHPMSADVKKNWSAEKFIALAHKLEREGYQPYFCVSPMERADWKTSVAEEQLPHFPTVSDLAAFVYESGYLIGNDSGVGHLASVLHIPTLSIFARRSYSHLWRPGWGMGSVISPPNLLLGGRMKQRYWKSCLSVGRVRRAFNRLREITLAHHSLSEPKF